MILIITSSMCALVFFIGLVLLFFTNIFGFSDINNCGGFLKQCVDVPYGVTECVDSKCSFTCDTGYSILDGACTIGEGEGEGVVENGGASGICKSDVNGGVCTLPMYSPDEKYSLYFKAHSIGGTVKADSKGELIISNNERVIQQTLPSKDTTNQGPYTLIMQSDGNAVVYRDPVKAGNHVWFSDTWLKGTGPYQLRLQNDDGNLAVWDSNGSFLWDRLGHSGLPKDGSIV